MTQITKQGCPPTALGHQGLLAFWLKVTIENAVRVGSSAAPCNHRLLCLKEQTCEGSRPESVYHNNLCSSSSFSDINSSS